MRTVFVHGEVEQHAEARELLVERFLRWRAGESADVVREFAELLLDDKLARDGLLARWTGPDLERFLAEVVPRRVVLRSAWSAVPEFLRLWVEFLSASGMLVSGSGSLAELHAAVDRVEPEYLAAMAEPAAWSAEKFWAETMAEHGVDVDDEQEVVGFLELVERGEVELDEQALEEVEARDALVDDESQPAYWLPPASVLDGDTPGEQAPGTAVLSRMEALHAWVGEGRALRDGAPEESDVDELAAALGGDEPADRFEVELLLEWAQRAGLLRVAGGKLVRSSISDGLQEQPGLLWTKLWDVLPELDELVAERYPDTVFAAEDGEAFAVVLAEALCALYAQSDAVPVELLTRLLAEALAESGSDDPDAEPVRPVLELLLAQWESMGALRRFTTGDPDQLAVIESVAPTGREADRTAVELLPLGLWAARKSLRESGFVAPTVDEMVDQPAEVVALVLALSPPDVVEEVIAAWVERRGTAAASEEIAALLRSVDDPAVRLNAFGLLEHTGQDGVAAAVALTEDPVAGPAARMWLQARPVPAEVPTQPGDDLKFSLDAMAVTLAADPDAFLAEFREQPTTSQIAVLDEIPRTGHARAEQVLREVADEHPDGRVARAAQRALEQLGRMVEV